MRTLDPAEPVSKAEKRQLLTRSQRRGVEAAAKSPRRRRIDPTTCDRDYSADELEFMQAMQAYKQASQRPFPTWSEVLEVLKSIGYSKS